MEKKPKSKTQKATVAKTPKPRVAKTRAAKAPAASRVFAPPPPRPVISPQERHRRIAEAAYFLALRRGVGQSDPQQNWIDAERQIDAELDLHGIRVG
jgi:hypothetical protein